MIISFHSKVDWVMRRRESKTLTTKNLLPVLRVKGAALTQIIAATSRRGSLVAFLIGTVTYDESFQTPIITVTRLDPGIQTNETNGGCLSPNELGPGEIFIVFECGPTLPVVGIDVERSISFFQTGLASELFDPFTFFQISCYATMNPTLTMRFEMVVPNATASFCETGLTECIKIPNNTFFYQMENAVKPTFVFNTYTIDDLCVLPCCLAVNDALHKPFSVIIQDKKYDVSIDWDGKFQNTVVDHLAVGGPLCFQFVEPHLVEKESIQELDKDQYFSRRKLREKRQKSSKKQMK